MKRLTQKDEQGNWSLRGVRWEQLYQGQIITQEVYERLCGALWKLMEYEDTDLSPEDVERVNSFDGSQAIKATMALQEEQRRHRWIPVEERLPETSGYMRENEKVLILLPDGTRTVSFYIDVANGEKIFFDGWDLYRPVAWMPLPEPYRPSN